MHHLSPNKPGNMDFDIEVQIKEGLQKFSTPTKIKQKEIYDFNSASTVPVHQNNMGYDISNFQQLVHNEIIENDSANEKTMYPKFYSPQSHKQVVYPFVLNPITQFKSPQIDQSMLKSGIIYNSPSSDKNKSSQSATDRFIPNRKLTNFDISHQNNPLIQNNAGNIHFENQANNIHEDSSLQQSTLMQPEMSTQLQGASLIQQQQHHIFAQHSSDLSQSQAASASTERYLSNNVRQTPPISIIKAFDLYHNRLLNITHQPFPLMMQYKEMQTFQNNNHFRYQDNQVQNNNQSQYFQQVINTNTPLELQNGNGDNIQIKKIRSIPALPYKVLDAPSLQDDFYLNLLDWSSMNVLSVGLGYTVYLWEAESSKVTKLFDSGEDAIASVQWNKSSNLLGVGSERGIVQLWDIEKQQKTQSFKDHQARVGVLSWNGNNTLSSGSRDKIIVSRDIRSPCDSQKLVGHKQEICGLKWSFDGQYLASGGNDNKLLIWNASSSTPILKFAKHKAAVKALAWSPHQHGMLASGGGTADKTICFWSVNRGQHLHSLFCGSQVCNLMFSKNVNELVSTHGYSENQINIWDVPTFKKIGCLTGHTYRVLYLSMSPNGETIVTGSGDETLRFWNVFPKREQQVGYSILEQNNFDYLR